jgi:hypothetical protein
MRPRCLLCLEPSDDRHHLTGCDADGERLDPELTGRLCHSCHELAGDDMNTAGIPDRPAADTFLSSLELRLSRTASFLGRVAEATPDPLRGFLACLARHLAEWARRLRTSIGALDQNAPGWRKIPGV